MNSARVGELDGVLVAGAGSGEDVAGAGAGDVLVGAAAGAGLVGWEVLSARARAGGSAAGWSGEVLLGVPVCTALLFGLFGPAQCAPATACTW